jgi:deoxyribonuclease V
VNRFFPKSISPKEAVRRQREWAAQVIRKKNFSALKTIAGADAAFSKDKKRAIAGVVLYSFPSLEEIERVYAVVPLAFPYVPGLLSFREGPGLLKAFAKLNHKADLAVFDGQGLAHPRHMGIASHMGLALGMPTIGCAKSRLCGTFREPGTKRGSRADLILKNEIIGKVLRTRDGVKPIYVSIGHRIDLKNSVETILKCHDGTRIPKPTREADHYVSALKKELS